MWCDRFDRKIYWQKATEPIFNAHVAHLLSNGKPLFAINLISILWMITLSTITNVTCPTSSWSLVFFCFLRRISTLNRYTFYKFRIARMIMEFACNLHLTTFTRWFTLLISLSVHEQNHFHYSNHKNAISLLLFLKFPPFVYIDAFPVRHTDSLFLS